MMRGLLSIAIGGGATSVTASIETDREHLAETLRLAGGGVSPLLATACTGAEGALLPALLSAATV